MVVDDGDPVRGLGFVTMYSAWAEEFVDELLRLLDPIEPFNDKKLSWMISRKLKHASKLVKRLKSPELDELIDDLDNGISLFEDRNKVVHGRIYAGYDKKDYIKSGRPKIPTREITSAELYELANEFNAYLGHLGAPAIFRLPRAIKNFLKHP